MKHLDNKSLAVFLTLLVILACGSVASADGTPALTVAADSSTAEPGDAVTFTIALTGGKDAHIDGIGFHVQMTEGLTVESASVDCAPRFQMSSYSKASGLFSAAAAKNGKGIDDDVWQILTVICIVTKTASGEQKLYISKTFDGAQDPKWSLFWLDDSNDAHELECDLSRAYASVTVRENDAQGNDDNTEAQVKAGEKNEPPSGQPSAAEPGKSKEDHQERETQNASRAGETGCSAVYGSAAKQEAAGENDSSGNKSDAADQTADGEMIPKTNDTSAASVSNDPVETGQKLGEEPAGIVVGENRTDRDGKIDRTESLSVNILGNAGSGKQVILVAAAGMTVIILAAVIVSIRKGRKR